MDNRLACLIATAIAHLNFYEREKALSVLFDALTELNFRPFKENTHGRTESHTA